MRKLFQVAAAVGALSAPAEALEIGFEDITQRNNFWDMGIAQNYQGYTWGFSNGINPIWDAIPGGHWNGWATATLSDPAIGAGATLSPPAMSPAGVIGQSYAWNGNGVTSLWINFNRSVDFNSAYFATASSGYMYNARSIRLFGYDANRDLLSQTSTLALTDTMSLFSANLVGINYLEIRASGNYVDTYFSLDDLSITPVDPVSPRPVPAPTAGAGASSLGLAALFMGWLAYRRRSYS